MGSETKQTYYQKNKDRILKKQQDDRDSKYIGMVEGHDYICCKECGFRSSELATHIISKHDMTVLEYKDKHNVSTIKSQSSIDRVKGDKNPAYQHGGKYSAFSDRFIYADTTDKEAVTSKAKLNKQLLNRDTTKLGYWLEHTGGDVQKAQMLLSERQTTFSLNICIDKYGDEAGRQVWLDRQEKWHNSYKKSNFSKISQELFWEIAEYLPTLSGIFFAQLNPDKNIDLSGTNNELRLKLCRVILPDFIDTKTRKIIEFDGTYWHGSVGRGNKEREDIRDSILENNNYSILHISESDYKNDKQGTIDKCTIFLTV